MATATERKEVIERLRSLPSMLEQAVNDLDDSQLDTPYGEGKWTPRQVVHHLADSHSNGVARMRWILTEEKPTLKTYEQDGWAKLYDALRLPIGSSLSIIRGLHERLVALLESVPEEAWSRTAEHPEDGMYTLEGLVEVYAEHGERHVKQITDLRERKGW